MGKLRLSISLSYQRLALVGLITAFAPLALSQSISDKVNTHLKDTQWRIDFEREVLSDETVSLIKPNNLKIPREKRPAATFGIVNHEENPHFDTRTSFDPKKDPTIGNNLNSWAEHSVNHYRESQQLTTARQAEWLKNFIITARQQGYDVKVDNATMQVQLIPIKRKEPLRSTAGEHKLQARPKGF